MGVGPPAIITSMHINLVSVREYEIGDFVTMAQTMTVSAKQFSFYLPVSLVNQVREYAKQQGDSASNVVEQLVSDALKAKGSE